jgi:hypothetical protein
MADIIAHDGPLSAIFAYPGHVDAPLFILEVRFINPLKGIMQDLM